MLTTGFNANSITIDQIRKILIAHDVDFTGCSRKADYVRVFNENIAPRATELRSQVQGVIANSAGIVDAPARRRTRSRSPAKASPTKAPASPRKTTRKKVKEEDKEAVAKEHTPEGLALGPPTTEVKEPASPRKRTKKTLSKKVVEPSATEDEVPDLKPNDAAITFTPKPRGRKKERDDVAMGEQTPSPRKRTAKKEKTEVKTEVKAEDKGEVQDEEMKEVTEEKTSGIQQETSPFSDKNVFQSSSPSAKKRSGTEREQESLASPSQKRRKTKTDENKGTTPQTKKITKDDEQKYTTPRSSMTGATPMRHFVSFPSTPEDDQFATPEQQLKQAPVPQTAPFNRVSEFQDHTFQAAASERKPKKRQSFMPNLSELRMSNEFRQLADQAKSPRRSLNFEPVSTASELVQEVEAKEAQDEKLEDQVQDLTRLEKEVDSELEKIADEREKVEQEKKRKQINWRRAFERVLGLIVVGLIGTYLWWWCQERIEVGYCNVGFVSDDHYTPNEDASLQDQILDIVSPKCVPCPNHATCYPHFKLVCDEDFLYMDHPLSFGGRIPLVPSCVPDTEKQRRVMVLVNKALDVLRQLNADWECGTSTKPATVDRDELKQMISEMKAETLSDEEFDDLWNHAIRDIEAADDVIVDKVRQSVKGYAKPGEETTDIITTKTLVRSTSLANISFSCRCRLAIRASVERHRGTIGLILTAIVAVVGGRYWLKMRMAYNKMIQGFVQEALRQLIQQQELSDNDTKGVTPRYVASAHLRDAALAGETSQKRKEMLWKQVQRVIESNSNIRVRQLEVHGEIMKVWEWIGPSSEVAKE
uniref:ARAD1D28424p n=1 Tax=Blastobotrys adeninivorans TaxID=409370 RepID=A0A060TG78_BLAAD